LPSPSNLCQLQILQGKANLLRRFISNYAKLTKYFTRLFKNDIPFIWDELAEKYFDALKHALTHAPLLYSLDYHQVYFLYLVASDATIGMVLV